jgi:hypothetical protein
LQRRRARARQAQKEFQQRKQALLSSLETRVSFLEDTIEKMSNEFLSFGDRLLNTSPRTEILNDLKETTKRFVDLARAVAPSTAEERAAQATDNSSTRIVTTVEGPFHHEPTGEASSASMGSTSLIFPSQHRTSLTPHSRANLMSPGRFSPRMDYSFVSQIPDFPMPTTALPIRPYLISGRTSFATRLYMETISTILEVLIGRQFVPGFIPSVARYRLRHEPPSKLAGLIQAQLNALNATDFGDSSSRYRLKSHVFDGFLAVAPKNEANEPFSTIGAPQYERLKHMMSAAVNELEQEGGNIAEWLDPWGTQNYLQNRWRFQVSYSTVEVDPSLLRNSMGLGNVQRHNAPKSKDDDFRGRLGENVFAFAPASTQRNTGDQQVIPGSSRYEHGTSTAADVIENSVMDVEQPHMALDASKLIKDLGMESVCFGDGPRFRKSKVDATVISYLSSMLPA